ncbi:hypothetical protein [uncultured Clostridium sp.]|uniref:hypothetical protein n=1 Tax=uncultured Clostridium sp. TaxID=59620 RepID=UPI0032179A07
MDAANVSSKDRIDKLNKTGDLTVKKGYDASLCYNFFNQENKYFKNVKIRKAFFQQNYNNELGINIDIAYIEWEIFCDKTDNTDYELAGMPVTADYNDPLT